VNTFRRPALLRESLDHWRRCAHVHTVQVVWSDTERAPPDDIEAPEVGASRDDNSASSRVYRRSGGEWSVSKECIEGVYRRSVSKEWASSPLPVTERRRPDVPEVGGRARRHGAAGRLAAVTLGVHESSSLNNRFAAPPRDAPRDTPRGSDGSDASKLAQRAAVTDSVFDSLGDARAARQAPTAAVFSVGGGAPRRARARAVATRRRRAAATVTRVLL